MKNGYQLETVARELDRGIPQEVIHDDRLYDLYTDALVLIHDLVCEFSDSQDKPRFTLVETEGEISRVLDDLYNVYKGENQRLLQLKVATNIQANYDLAKKIRHAAEKIESSDERFEAEITATQFARSLLQIYNTLRILQQDSAPAHL